MEKLDIYQRLAQEISRGELAFPTSARVAMRIRHALDDPNSHLDNVAKLIQADPLLAARVVALANSVAFNRYGREIVDVRAAVTRLGVSTLQSLVIAQVAHQFADTASAEGARLEAGLWEHSVQVAALAHAVARHVTHVDPDAALFAGIVHEMGGFYMLWRAHEIPGLLDGDYAAWIEHGEVTVGSAILKALAVPQSIIEAIRVYWDGYLAMPPASLGDTLLLADELATRASPLRQLGGDAPGEGMTASLDLLVGKAHLSDILDESAQEIASLMAALA